jgi:teichuronic acid exporter
VWFLSDWKPSLQFSKASFYELFGFGSKLLSAALLATFFNNLYKVVIGKVYTASSLGFYSQAYQFADISAGTITSVLQKVSFPILTSIQHEEARMISVYRKLLGMTAFIIFPAMTLFALLADPFIRFFLTDKWADTIPLLQWLCFARVVHPLSMLNLSILNAKGRSDLYLKVDVAKIPLTLIALVVTIPFGMQAVVIGHVVTSFLAFFIYAYMPGKLFSYGAWPQIKDMFDKIIATVVMAAVVFFINRFIPGLFLKLLVGGMTGLISYALISIWLRVEEVSEVKKLIFAVLKRK